MPEAYTRERTALAEFKKLLPTLNTYAKAASGRNLKVLVGTFNYTDGENIYLRPPMTLADGSKHSRNFCGQRADDGLLICDGCYNQESVLGGLHHEIAHLVHGTYTEYPNSMVQTILGEHIEQGLGKQAKLKFNKAMLRDKPYVWVGQWSYSIAKELPPWVLAMEDIRVNLESYNSMAGLRAMQFARYSQILVEGWEKEDGSYYRHDQADADVQVNMGVLFAAQGHEIRGWLADDVVDTIELPVIQALIERSKDLKTPLESVEVAIQFIKELRALGYYGKPEPQPEPIPIPQESEESEDEGDPGDSGDSAGDGSSGDTDDDPGSDSEESEEEGEGGSSDGGAGGTSDDGDPAEDEGESEPAEGGDSEPDSGDAPGDPGSDDTGAGSGADEGDGSGDEDHREGGAGVGSDESGDLGEDDGDSSHDSAEHGSDADPSDSLEDSGGNADGHQGSEQGSSDGEHVHEPSGSDGDGQDQSDEGASDEESPADRGGESSEDGGLPDDSDAVRGPSDDGADPSEGELGGQSDGTDGEGDDAEAGDLDSTGPEGAEPSDGDGDSSADQVGDESGAGELGEDGEDAEPSDQGEPGTEHSDAGDPGVAGSEDSAGGGTEQGDGAFGQGQAGTGEIEGPALDDTDTASGDEAGNGAGPGSGAERVLAPRPTSELEDRIDDLMQMLSGLLGHPMMEECDGHEPNMVANSDGVEAADGQANAVTHKHISQDDLEKVIQCLAYLDNISPNVDAPTVVREKDMRMSSTVPVIAEPGAVNRATNRARLIFAADKRVQRHANQKSGRIKGSTLGRRVPVQDVRLFERKTVPDKRDWETLIMMDRSLSTSGDVARQIRATVMSLAEVHSRVGIPFSVWTSSTEGIGWSEYGPHWAEVKAVKSPWDRFAMMRLGGASPLSGNLDGHSMQFCRKQLQQSRATHKLLVYFTDGEMPAANEREELEILKAEIQLMGKLNIKVIGVGMGTDSPKEHGLDTVEVNGAKDIGLVIDHLAKVLK